MTSMKPFDLIIFGATGFTGRYVVERLAQTAQKYGLPHRWAVAARDTAKMHTYLREIESTTGIADLRQRIPVIEADVRDFDSMKRAFQQATLVMNCIGPYSLLGEPVVKACIDARAHYMDLSGEPLFLELMQLKYDAEAAEKRVYIVGSCGFDSIPSDVGTQYLKQKFTGRLNHVDHYLETWQNSTNNFSYATWISLIEGYKRANELRKIREKLFAGSRAFKWPVAQKRRQFSRHARGYVVPFPGSDRSVVKRTQYARYRAFAEPPTQFEAYYLLHERTTLLKWALIHFSLKLFTKSRITEILLHNYGHIFSCGIFRRGVPPRRELLRENRFRLTLIGSGWPPDSIGPEDTSHAGNDTRMKRSAVIISGGDGAYIETATISIQTALAILERIEKNQTSTNDSNDGIVIPYGVITPATIVEADRLIARLVDEGIRVDFIDDYRD